jgi:diaminopimelate decarboxylase
MNDLIRPAFYEAYHEIVPLTRKGGALIKSDVVGPICESGDFFCQDRPLARAAQGDYLVLMSAGAYGSVMASNYNTRALAAEVLVNGRQAALVRERQQLDEIWGREKVARWLKPALARA